jgi:putative endonuclease
LGQYAENLAERLLRRRGLIVLARNWRGGGGELDRVFLRGDTIVFVEVKARRGSLSDWPVVRHAQTLRIRQAAQAFRKQFGVLGHAVRFDVVTVELRNGDEPDVRWNCFDTNPTSDSSRAGAPRE